MPVPPSGSILVKKVDGNQNFIEEILDSTDLLPLLPNEVVFTSGNQTISGLKTFNNQALFLTSGVGLAANSSMVLIRGTENYTRFGIEGSTPVFQGWKFNGTLESKTIVTNNNNLALFQGGGWNGTDFAPVTGRLSVRADADWGSGTSYPTRLDFETTASGLTTPSTKWRIDGTGHLSPITSGALNVGSASTPVANLYVDNLFFPGGGNFVTTTGGAQTVSGVKTFANGLTSRSNLTLSGNLHLEATETFVLGLTGDGSDIQSLVLAPGGNATNLTTRGGTLTLRGNEASNPGETILAAGNVTNGYLGLVTSGNQPIHLTTSGITRAALTSSGSVVFTTSGTGLLAGEGMVQIRGVENNTRFQVEGSTPVFQGGHFGGTLDSKTLTLSGNALAFYQAGGYDGSQIFNSGRMVIRADADWSLNSRPTRLDFETTASGSAVVTGRWRIDKDGHFVPVTHNTYNIGISGTGGSHVANAFINNIFNDISGNDLDLTSRNGGNINLSTDAGGATTVRMSVLQDGTLKYKQHSGYSGSDYVTTTTGVNTTNNTTQTAWALTLADNYFYNFRVKVIGRHNNATAKGIWADLNFGVYRNNASAATMIGTRELTMDDVGSPGYSADVDVSSNDVRIRITGGPSETVSWVILVEYIAVSTST